MLQVAARTAPADDEVLQDYIALFDCHSKQHKCADPGQTQRHLLTLMRHILETLP
jgi:hypothetical protein